MMRRLWFMTAAGPPPGAGAHFALARRPLLLVVVRAEADVPLRIYGLGTVGARVLSRMGFDAGGTIAAANRRQQDLARRGVASRKPVEAAQHDEAVARADLAMADEDRPVAGAQWTDAAAAPAQERVLLTRHRLAAPDDALVVARLVAAGTEMTPGNAVVPDRARRPVGAGPGRHDPPALAARAGLSGRPHPHRVEHDACIVTVTHDEKILDRFDRLVQLRDGRLASA